MFSWGGFLCSACKYSAFRSVHCPFFFSHKVDRLLFLPFSYSLDRQPDFSLLHSCPGGSVRHGILTPLEILAPLAVLYFFLLMVYPYSVPSATCFSEHAAPFPGLPVYMLPFSFVSVNFFSHRLPDWMEHCYAKFPLPKFPVCFHLFDTWLFILPFGTVARYRLFPVCFLLPGIWFLLGRFT